MQHTFNKPEKMNRDELRILLEKYEKQTCTEKEAALLDTFFDSYTKPGQWRNWGREDVTTYEANLLADIKARI